MLRFAWRWAQVGDRVLVHDRENLERDLMNGVVAVVNRVNHDTSIGIKLDDNGETQWLWPTPLFVHPSPLDPDESCWICKENAVPTPPPNLSPTKEATV